MPVDSGSRAYNAMRKKWERCRDCYEGEDAVKDKGTEYLPKLASHKDIDPGGYDSYKARALFYNATARTVDGLAGAVFQKAPELTAPDAIMEAAKDITLTDETLDMFAHRALREKLITGRFGVLVDRDGEGPVYWSGYVAEDILETRTARVRGDQVLTRVVLREHLEETNAGDRFAAEAVEQYRVLELTDAGYQQTVFRRVKDSEDFTQAKTVKPLRNDKPLPFIPFIPMGPKGVSARISKPPILDLVDVNLSHYRTMADLEHGRHFVAMPQPYISGSPNADGPLYWGSSQILDLDENAKIGIVEFTGQGLAELRNADEQKRHLMAILGARILEDQPRSRQNETATSVSMRHAGEQANLRTIAMSADAGLTMALQVHEWWTTPTLDSPKNASSSLTTNKDFSGAPMPAQDILAITTAVEGGTMSKETAVWNLESGNRLPPGVSVDEELARIGTGVPTPQGGTD